MNMTKWETCGIIKQISLRSLLIKGATMQEELRSTAIYLTQMMMTTTLVVITSLPVLSVYSPQCFPMKDDSLLI